MKWENLPESKFYGLDKCDKCGAKIHLMGLCKTHFIMWSNWYKKSFLDINHDMKRNSLK